SVFALSSFGPTQAGVGPALTPGTIPDVVAKASSSVGVVIGPDGHVHGTAFLVDRVDAGQLALTANHVVQQYTRVSLLFPGVQVPFTAKVIARGDPNHDVAVLLVIARSPERPLPLARMDLVRQGDDAVAVGYPLTDQLGTGQPTVTVGVVSKVVSGQDLQMQTPISAGSSGSPVLNVEGE